MLVLQCLIFLLVLLTDGDAWTRRRRRRRCSARDCEVSEWSHWSGCSQRCGVIETQYRTRYKTRNEVCGGKCYYDLRVQRNCHMICNNGGTPSYSQCHCRTGFMGSCCELDRNECQMDPNYCRPGGFCINTHGSFRCLCSQGYVSTLGGTVCVEKRDDKANPSSRSQASSGKSYKELIICGSTFGCIAIICWALYRYKKKTQTAPAPEAQQSSLQPGENGGRATAREQQWSNRNGGRATAVTRATETISWSDYHQRTGNGNNQFEILRFESLPPYSSYGSPGCDSPPVYTGDGCLPGTPIYE